MQRKIEMTAQDLIIETELTSRELLKQVNQAISAILKTGQSYSIGSHSLTRANLTELRNIRAELMAEVNAEDAAQSGLVDNTYVGFFNGR